MARVLIVDDNRDAADAMGEFLGLLGHDVRVAYSPTAALALASEIPPDVALLDLGLPEMTGVELGTALRGMVGGDAIRLIAVTGYGTPADRRRTSAAGFERHLMKPADPAEIQAAI